MNTQIIELGPGDDWISVREKLDWIDGGRLLLVWPKKKSLTFRKVDLVLILRKSKEAGLQLGIVCTDAHIRQDCLQVGIPVFSNAAIAQTAHWRVSRDFRSQKKKQLSTVERSQRSELHRQLAQHRAGRERPISPSLRLAIFAMGILSMLAIAATLLPKAQVVVEPKIRHQEIVFDLFTSDQVEEISLQGAVPSELVSIEVADQDSIDVSGTIFLPYQPASGEVIFKNLGDREIHVPQGTIVRVSGDGQHRYSTKEDVLVPAGYGQSIPAIVESEKPGTQGNLAAGSINAIEGNLGTLLIASNPEPIVGGTDREEPVPTDIDRASLSEGLDKSMREHARNELSKELSPNDIFLEDTLRISEVITEQFDPPDEYPTNTLSLACRKRYEARVVRFSEVKSLLTAMMNAEKPEGFDPLTDNFNIVFLDNPHLSGDNRVVWTIHAERTLQAVVDRQMLLQLAVGTHPSEAARKIALVSQFDSAPQIQLNPAWWPVMPVLPFRIDIQTIQSLDRNQSGQGDS